MKSWQPGHGIGWCQQVCVVRFPFQLSTATWATCTPMGKCCSTCWTGKQLKKIAEIVLYCYCPLPTLHPNVWSQNHSMKSFQAFGTHSSTSCLVSVLHLADRSQSRCQGVEEPPEGRCSRWVCRPWTLRRCVAATFCGWAMTWIIIINKYIYINYNWYHICIHENTTWNTIYI